jgi:hypothetical protein
MINRSADDAASGTGGSAGAPLIVDNFDDPEGYYRIILGELLDNGRYHVHANLGKGMFSNVVRAKDLQSAGESASAGATNADAPGGEQREVAIKIVRSQESMCVLMPSHLRISTSNANAGDELMYPRCVAQVPRGTEGGQHPPEAHGC